MMDLGPTILELAGCEPAPSMEGRSLLPALEGRAGYAQRDVVYAEHARDGILQGTQLVSMVRERRWKLVSFIDCPDGRLFDLENDPEELRNLSDHTPAAGKRNRLLLRIGEWHLEGATRTAGWKERRR